MGYALSDLVDAQRQHHGRRTLTLSPQGVASLEADPAGVALALKLDAGNDIERETWPSFFLTRCSTPYWPKFVHCRRMPGSIVVVAQLQEDTYWFRGHFPGEPVFPGVAQLNWAIEAAMGALEVRGRFAGIDGLKFQNIMRPGDYFTLQVDYLEAEHRLRFKYLFKDGFYSQGRVRFKPVNVNA